MHSEGEKSLLETIALQKKAPISDHKTVTKSGNFIKKVYRCRFGCTLITGAIDTERRLLKIEAKGRNRVRIC